MMNNVHPKYLTQEGYAALEKELHDLRTTQRTAIAETLHDIVDEGGDLLENTAFQEAKLEQGWLEGRIHYLESILAGVTIINKFSENISVDVVHLDSTVTVQEEGYPPEIYHLVGTAEANPLEGRLSDVSPLGQALVGKHCGETIVVRTPDGDTLFHILDVH